MEPAASRGGPELRTFQRRFLQGALAPGITTAALSLPRGNGKSWIAAHILARCLTPGDPLYAAGAEYLLVSGTLQQARIVWRFVRQFLGEFGYSYLDNSQSVGVHHTGSATRLRVMTSNPKSAFGIVGTPLLVADEPGAWEVNGGGMMWDAIETAQGKPGSPLRVVLIGTLAPALRGWWHDLVNAGSSGSTYVQALQGDRESWDSWHTIRKANPLTAVSPEFRRKLLEERDAARADTRLRARFLSYRLNLPSADESQVLLAPEDWERIVARPVPEASGRPIVGVDLGQGRSWSAAAALWPNGRCETIAVAPGIPSLAEQETRDRVPRGLYQALQAHGRLVVAHGLRVQPPAQLWDAIRLRWGTPEGVICDRFRLGELEDAIAGACPVEPRVTRWAEASADIRALRKIAKDGPLAVEQSSRGLLAASLEAAEVKTDDQGSMRLVKKGANSESRDDVAAALLLAAGGRKRHAGRPSSYRTAVVG